MATVGMVLLMLTTSVAVLVFFLRHRELGGGKLWQTRLAPVLAVLGLLGSLWLVLSNFTLVTGGSVTLSTILAAVPFAGLILGGALAAPVAAYAAYRIPDQPLMILVGSVIVLLSIRGLITALT